MALQLLLFMLVLGSSLRLQSVMGRSIMGNETDRLSLLEFKKQVDDPYGALSSWNDSIHLCNWVGVTCGRRHQRVISFDLEGMGLGGDISPSIGNLSFLHFFNIANNSFHGKIPQEIGSLIRLQIIYLTNNTLEGEIPTSLANCTHLREIYLSYNNLFGKIPVELTSLSKLEVISINFNTGLTGEIPASFGNMSSLQSISLGANGLVGRIPESFGQLRNLYFLALPLNYLSGMFPLSIYNLSALQIISLANNQLQGSLPRDIGLTLPNLQGIGLAENNFSGRIPNSISNISTLKVIDLQINSFVGPVPHNLGNLQHLQRFTIGDNQFGVREADDFDFINSLANCTNLEYLGLEDNGFKGPLPNFIANLSPQLSLLGLNGNQISGTIPTGICDNLVNLTLLDMDGNFLEGNIPSNIGKLSKLQILTLSGNRFSGQIPSSIGNLIQLSTLALDCNNLNATIPSSLGNCQQLEILSLGNNNLQGPIPIQLFYIYSLSISLNLSHNSLVGTLPGEIGNLESLSALDISNNKLSGEIPSSIGDCKSLQQLYMEDNFFEGTIPQSLTLLKGLQDLDLSCNNLSSQLPTDLENLSTLQSLNLSFNNLEGEVPTRGIFGNASAISVNGNDKLCGGIPELQLPACTRPSSTKREKSHTFKIILAIISVVLGFLLISSFLILYWTRISKPKPASTPLVGDHFVKVSYKELFEATGGFSSANFLGSGSFGSVYKGIINQDETIVAVKVLNLQNPRACKSFLAECEALRNIRHRNLVKIITSCSSLDSKGEDFKALVYEFMPNGSLEDWLHLSMEEPNHSRNLNLFQRLNITIDVASALDYLHSHCYAPIIHCDLKPSNVLLDSDMNAHIGDFGLARLLLEADNNSSQTQTSTLGIKGSIGYVAPAKSLACHCITLKELNSTSPTSNHSRNINLLQRLNITIDVASILDYLHYHCYASIIPCDLKPSNVVLDSDMNAHIGDFGFARLLLECDNNYSHTHTSTLGIKGSIGYTTPEYGMGGKATIEGDVFSFGILLLEIFTGKRPTDQMFTDGLNLHNFVKAPLAVHVLQIIDPKLLSTGEHGEEIQEEAINKTKGAIYRQDELQICVTSILEIALCCSMGSPKERMNMNDVVRELNLIKRNFLGVGTYQHNNYPDLKYMNSKLQVQDQL